MISVGEEMLKPGSRERWRKRANLVQGGDRGKGLREEFSLSGEVMAILLTERLRERKAGEAYLLERVLARFQNEAKVTSEWQSMEQLTVAHP